MTRPILDRTIEALTWCQAEGLAPPDPVTGAGAVGALERSVASRLGVPAAVAVASGTDALFVAMRCAGVGPGDEVLIPAVDWSASAAVVGTLGATAVVVAPRAGGFCIDPIAVHDAVSDRTRAVVVTHLHGEPGPATEIRDSLERRGITIVEDCAHGWGTRTEAGPAGSVGRFGCFSLGHGKELDAGGGGLLAVRDASDIESVLRCSQHPTRQEFLGIPDPTHGLNHRIHPIAAVVALHEIRSGALDRRLSAQAEKRERIRRALNWGDGYVFGDSSGHGWFGLHVVSQWPLAVRRRALSEDLTVSDIPWGPGMSHRSTEVLLRVL